MEGCSCCLVSLVSINMISPRASEFLSYWNSVSSTCTCWGAGCLQRKLTAEAVDRAGFFFFNSLGRVVASSAGWWSQYMSWKLHMNKAFAPNSHPKKKPGITFELSPKNDPSNTAWIAAMLHRNFCFYKRPSTVPRYRLPRCIYEWWYYSLTLLPSPLSPHHRDHRKDVPTFRRWQKDASDRPLCCPLQTDSRTQRWVFVWVRVGSSWLSPGNAWSASL